MNIKYVSKVDGFELSEYMLKSIIDYEQLKTNFYSTTDKLYPLHSKYYITFPENYTSSEGYTLLGADYNCIVVRTSKIFDKFEIEMEKDRINFDFHHCAKENIMIYNIDGITIKYLVNSYITIQNLSLSLDIENILKNNKEYYGYTFTSEYPLIDSVLKTVNSYGPKNIDSSYIDHAENVIDSYCCFGVIDPVANQMKQYPVKLFLYKSNGRKPTLKLSKLGELRLYVVDGTQKDFKYLLSRGPEVFSVYKKMNQDVSKTFSNKPFYLRFGKYIEI